MGAAKAVGSLKTLVNKSLIDEYPNGEFSIHPLIYSFVVDKAKQSDFADVIKSSRNRFSAYYLLSFERLNDAFLAGKSIESPQLEDTMQHVSIAIDQSITNGLENFQDLFRILSKAEIFLFVIGFYSGVSLDIPTLYDLAIEICRARQYNNYACKLYVSKYFHSIAFSFFVPFIHSDIPDHIRKDVMLLSDGSGAKLGCYEGISLICKGNIESGIECIEKHLDGLQKCADQQLVKCLCLQLLAILYSDFKEYSKSSNVSRKAIDVCEGIGNCNLFLIGECEQTSSVTQKEGRGEQLILFIHLLYMWSKKFSRETKLYFFNFVNNLQQQLENNQFCSIYLFQILMYGDLASVYLGSRVERDVLLDEKIKVLNKSLKSDEYCSLTERTFSHLSEMSATKLFLPERLFNCYTIKMIMSDHTKKQSLNVDTCRDALDLSRKQYGKEHQNTAFCYLRMGLAENAAENYTSALDAFDHALEILIAIQDGSSNNDEELAKVYIGKGETYTCINDFEPAIASFDEALNITRRLFNEDTEQMAQILFKLGASQWNIGDLSSALGTLKQALQIWIKLYDENPSFKMYMDIVACYVVIGKVHYNLGNNTESVKCLKAVLEVSTDCNEGRYLAQVYICAQLAELQVDENLFLELLSSSLPVITGNYKSFLPMLYLTLCRKQLESGKYEAGLASLQKALDTDLDVAKSADASIREWTISSYIAMTNTLVKIGKSKLARRTIDRATKIAESLPEGSENLWVFRCYTCKGRIQNEMGDYTNLHVLIRYPFRLSRSPPQKSSGIFTASNNH